jgi:hypothetical protein
VTELVVRRLLPLAARGLEAWGVTDEQFGRLLGIIEQRCLTARNGATWVVEQVHAASGDREAALRATLREYRARMHSNEPVHAW